MTSKNTDKVLKGGASVGIPPRHMDFQFSETMPKYFYANNATATIFFAMLSASFPPGERFFMDSVRHFRNRVTDKRQRAAISGFMGQEAIHGREHDRLNELLAERGFDMETPERFVKVMLSVLTKLPKSTQLAATTFMEHFTALLAEQLLEDEEFRSLADPEMIKIWQWHALEELEHKAVAYDVYELIGNSHGERIAAAAAMRGRIRETNPLRPNIIFNPSALSFTSPSFPSLANIHAQVTPIIGISTTTEAAAAAIRSPWLLPISSYTS